MGLVLVGVFWSLTWSLPGLRTHWCFFPLWLGYCLTVDAWNWRRMGTSLWSRGRRSYAGLFLASIPVWWLFELINLRTGNWHYLGRAEFSDFAYAFFASLSFSTVLPAIFGTAELVSSSRRMDRVAAFASCTLGGGVLLSAGIVVLCLCLLWPRYFFPLVWLALFMIVDPVNEWWGNASIIGFIRRGNWRPVVSLGLGCLICGFFWEMWNFYSYPKWEYDIPFLGFFHIFEMPVLGYGGYIPFSLEAYALYHFLAGLTGRRESPLRFATPSGSHQPDFS